MTIGEVLVGQRFCFQPFDWPPNGDAHVFRRVDDSIIQRTVPCVPGAEHVILREDNNTLYWAAASVKVMLVVG
jgi:hypothetical protein